MEKGGEKGREKGWKGKGGGKERRKGRRKGRRMRKEKIVHVKLKTRLPLPHILKDVLSLSVSAMYFPFTKLPYIAYIAL